MGILVESMATFELIHKLTVIIGTKSTKIYPNNNY